jgi:sigma-B regulation protein RsbU (phosphoserine phosphatase)
MDASGDVSDETSVKFKISPPWYRTILAYLFYLGLLGYLFILFGKYQAKKSRGKAEDERRMAELEAAKDLQNRMLPKTLPKVDGLEIATYLQTSTEVGGDYYDFDPQPDGSLVAVCGDATGHGTAAGMLVSIIKAGLIGLPLDEPNKMLYDLNRLVKKVDLGILRMSLNIVHFKENKLKLSSAAMPPCYLYVAKTKQIEEIQICGLPLGGLYGATFDIEERSFSKGDIFVIASDGLPEAPNLKGEQLGYQAVEDCILANADKTATELKDAMVLLGSDWLAGQTTPDDITLVVIKKTND